MAKCPNCGGPTQQPNKQWPLADSESRCISAKSAGNQFRDFFKENTLKFVLSAITVVWEKSDRQKKQLTGK
jgi:hypothetical protein